MSELEYSKHGKRELSEFMGRNLLYDFNHEKLDPERAQGVLKLINTSEKMKNDLVLLQAAETYLNELSEWRLPEKVSAQLGRSPNLFEVFSQKVRFSEWPDGLKMGLELTVILGIMCLGLTLVPWDRLILNRHGQSHQLQLAQVDHDKDYEFDESQLQDGNQKKGPQEKSAEADKPAAAIAKSGTKPNRGNDVGETPNSDADEIKPLVKAVESLAKATSRPVGEAPQKLVQGANQEIQEDTEPEGPSAADEKAPVTAAPPPTALKTVANRAKAPPTADENQKPVPQSGSLLRGTFTVDDLDAVTEKYIQIISGMGGKKAGEVKLGWKKENGTYFHFTMPSNQVNALTDLMKGDGNLTLQKEKHERVMPQGTERIIITFKQKPQEPDEKK